MPPPEEGADEASLTEGRFSAEGKTLSLSRLDKVMYPAAAMTKRDVIAYYLGVAPVLLPHLRAGR